MKKTIASMALLASATSAMAIVGPINGAQESTMIGGGKVPTKKVYCLAEYEDQDGDVVVSSCDAKARNARFQNADLNKYGCLEGQAAMITYQEVNIPSCPVFVQL